MQARQKPKPRKAIKQRGKGFSRYQTWLHVVARPYLEERYGRDCSDCKAPPPVNEETGEIGWHDVDHIKTRGGHHELKYSVHNIRFLCQTCHSKRK